MDKPDYYSRVNPDLLALIPPDCRVVLEIGCGAGALCEAYRRVNPGVIWWGVEMNSEAAHKARKTPLDFISRNHIEDESGCYGCNSIREWGTCRDADCLVLGDILEHLEDPWTILKELVEARLKPGAQVLASIPNVQHFSIIYRLLRGEWEYVDEGLMDRTHLRWFTL
jgi:2-polyprenyl-3-methyl-5-hydroxy-6-metoxy-1,4-benzoquinol methylase